MASLYVIQKVALLSVNTHNPMPDLSLFVDAEWYLARYPDVAQAGVNPQTHFVQNGYAEGRLPCALQSANAGTVGGVAAKRKRVRACLCQLGTGPLVCPAGGVVALLSGHITFSCPAYAAAWAPWAVVAAGRSRSGLGQA